MFGLFGRKKKKAKKEVEVQPVKQEEVKEEVQEEPEVEEVQEEKEVKEEVEVKEEKPEKKRKASNHITKHPQGGWQIKKSGASRALKKFRTQKEAIEYAKGLEETTGTAYVIHKADGKTRKKTY